MTERSAPAIQIDIPYAEVADFCVRYHIRKLALFGSVLRDDFDADSDVDVLVEFEEGHTPDFFVLSAIEQGLSGLLDGRPIDLATRKALNVHLRDQVLASESVIYG